MISVGTIGAKLTIFIAVTLLCIVAAFVVFSWIVVGGSWIVCQTSDRLFGTKMMDRFRKEFPGLYHK